jgi:tRNA(adenine34) deaminase
MKINADKDIAFMREALRYAKKAYKINEVPIGAVIVRDDKVISFGYNQKERKNVATKHAEMIAIERACRALGNWRLTNATLYVNVEPCIMCVGAILQARIKRVVYGCADKKFGACESLYNICDDKRLNHNFAVTKGVSGDESVKLLRDFFKKIRNK